MPFIIPAGAQRTDYKISRSLRFNHLDVDHLKRTPLVTGERRVFTVSAWVKRGLLAPVTGDAQFIFSATVDGTTNNYTALYFSHIGTAENNLTFLHYVGGVVKAQLRPTTKFRDPSAWVHVCASIDTTPAVPVVRLEVNGVLMSSFLVNINTLVQNELLFPCWPGAINYVGCWSQPTTPACYSGHITDLHLIDGHAAPASAFGQTDPETGEWMPKQYAGNFGATGVWLAFANNSSATATGIGKDFSGMSNLIAYSDDFTNAAWIKGANAVITPGQSDPLGGTRACNLTISLNTANPHIVYPMNFTAGQTQTMTVYLKAGAISEVLLHLNATSGGGAIFNLANGTIASSFNNGSGTNTSASISNVGGGWWKCSVTATHGTTISEVLYVFITSPSTVNGAGIVVFRASVVNGNNEPRELQYTNGAAVLGKDYTPVNLSVATGSANDSKTDSPTLFGSDNGLGGEVRGNYCAWNPLDAAPTSRLQIGSGGLALQTLATMTGWSMARGTMWVSTGKWYWEYSLFFANDGYALVGVLGAINTIAAHASTTTHHGMYSDGYAYHSNNGNKSSNNVETAYGAAFTTNDIIGVALDLDGGTITFFKNGVSQGPITLTSFFLWRYYAPAASLNIGPTATAALGCNFGQHPFWYTPPAGHKALCTQNLPDPVTKRPDNYSTIHSRSGTGTAYVVSGKRFQPEMIWAKDRTAANSHVINDVLRGPTVDLYPNETTVQTAGDFVRAFNSDGYTGGTNARINTSGSAYIDWMWKRGPGLDIVTYTGTGVARTIAHGLGIQPGMVIVKSRGTITNWAVHHWLSGASAIYYLNAPAGSVPNTTAFNATMPTSTVFSVGADAMTNANAVQYIAYLFCEVPGLQRVWEYVGNGLADGPFVWCGFKPEFVMIKSRASTNWEVFDRLRGAINPTNSVLFPNLPDPETSVAGKEIDFLSNGFKIRNTHADLNVDGVRFLFLAVAETPFKYARVRS